LNAGNFNVNGGRGRANNITIDNITSTDITVTGNGGQQVSPVNFEQIQEVKLITHNFSAEYGRNSGSQLQFITKSGGNTFHGVAYEFLRNDMFNARDFFDRTGNPAVTRRNQFGYVFGGPIVRNRTHFFQSYEGLQLRGQGAARIAQVPTPGMVAQITDPTAKKLFDQYQLPVSESGMAQQSAPAFAKAFQFSFRVDHQLSDNDTLNARYAHYQLEEGNSGITFFASNLANFGARSVNGPRNFNISETHLFSPTVVNEFRFGFGRSSPIFSINSTVPVGPRIQFANAQVDRFGAWEGLPQGRVQNTFQYSDTLSWVNGAHNLKAGVDLHRYQANSVFELSMRGLYTFNNWDDFAAGRPASYSQRFGGSIRGHRVTNHFYFLQDDWKLSRNLTVNLGMRLEVAGGVSEVNGLTSNLDLGCRDSIGSAGTGPFGCFAMGQASNKTGVNWGPRVGFAWNPRGDAKTVIRGGYGVAYDFMYLNPVVNQRFLPPFVITASLAGVTSFTGANSFANLMAGTSQIQAESLAATGTISPTFKNFGNVSPAIDTNLRNPQVQQWSFGLQREILRDVVLKASYVGSKSTYLQRTHPINLINDSRIVAASSLADETAKLAQYQAAVAAASGTATRPSNRIDPRFNEINLVESSANSNYHAFEFMAQKSFRQGYAMQVAYTAAKSIDDTSDALGVLINDSHVQQNPNDNRDNRAVSQFDIPQRLVITHSWELPFGKNLTHPVLRRVVAGWGLAGIASLRSGFPVTFESGARRGIQASTLTGLASGPVRPSTAGAFEFNPLPAGSAGVPMGLNTDPVQRISAYAANIGLSQPLLGAFGTLGRNTHRLNGERNFDWNLYKNTPLTERINLQLRAEFYNIFNNTSFQDVNRNISSAAFGQYTTVGQDARSLQLGLRLIF